jgi:hypothetical protein
MKILFYQIKIENIYYNLSKKTESLQKFNFLELILRNSLFSINFIYKFFLVFN